MSWLFSQALVEEYSEDTSSDGEPSVQSSGNPTQLAYLPPDKMTAFSRLSRFGMTFKPLTESLGQDVLTSFLEDFPVRTSQQQDEAQVLTEPDQECGFTWRESLAKYDLNTSTWRTVHSSLLEDSTEFLGTWPRWGLMHDGVSYRQQTLVRHTKETASGLWASQNSRDWKDSGPSQGKRKSPNLGTQVHWPTPRSCSAMAATITPESAWAENRFPNLETVVGRRLWPTPRTKGMCGGSGAWNQLNKATTPEEARQMGAGNGGQLNPPWVEWLMGWPLGWTDLRPLETDKFLLWQQQHSDF